MSRSLLGRALIGAALMGTAAAALLLVLQPKALPLVETARADDALIARGAYLARAADCAACHTAPGGQNFAGGMAIETPFGTLLASNITSDPDQGIGGWSEEAFARALRQGVSRDGHLLYPAMPYPAYTKMPDEDIHALKAYFDTVPGVSQRVEPNQLRFPLNIRQFMMGWNLLFFHEGRFAPSPLRDEAWNRGAYLVDGPGHCASCHSGKNPLGGDTAYLQGGRLQDYYAPDLTGNRTVGLGDWSAAQIVAYLKTGGTDRAMATGPMAEAVEHGTQYLSDGDLGAIAAYLKSLPASPATAPAPVLANDPVMTAGRDLYAVNCQACHRSDGTGVATMLPALARSQTVQAADPTQVIHTILSGGAAASTAANPTGAHMPGFAWKLDDTDVAALATYIRNSWGNGAAPVTTSEVAKLRG